jgi:hypothetical protein
MFKTCQCIGILNIKKKWSQEQKKEKNQNGIEGYDFLKRMRENCFQSKSSFDED